MIDKLVEYEKLFLEIPNIGEKVYIQKGNIPIIISTPHTNPHKRNGKIKNAEYFTGGIGRYVADKTNSYLIQNLSSENTDPNWDTIEKSVYKQKLVELIEEENIKFLMDLHGCRKDHPFLIELGTINKELESLNKDYEIFNIINNNLNYQLPNLEEKIKVSHCMEFKAENPMTIANFIHRETGIKTIQIEINWLLRDLRYGNNIEILVECLIDIINQIKYKL